MALQGRGGGAITTGEAGMAMVHAAAGHGYALGYTDCIPRSRGVPAQASFRDEPSPCRIVVLLRV